MVAAASAAQSGYSHGSSSGHTRGIPKKAEAHRALAVDKESLDDWAQRLWDRLDRDHSNYISKQELDCEDFHNIMRYAVAPLTQVNTGGAVYERSKVHIDQAIRLCLRKADQNDDSQLSFQEFKALLKQLREPMGSNYVANLAFSLFDLDGDRRIDRQEFRELLRFLMGRNLQPWEIEEEWNRLMAPVAGSLDAVESVDVEAYVEWIESSEIPEVRQQVPRPRHATAPNALSPSGSGSDRTSPFLEMSSTFPPPKSKSSSYSMKERPKWNQRFNCSINPGHINDVRPAGEREYFLRHQSLPELNRFWKGHAGSTFKPHLSVTSNPPPEPPKCALFPKVLSTEGGTPMTMPWRHEPGGTVPDLITGEVIMWEDHWSTPARYRNKFHTQHRPLAPRATFGDINDCTVSGDVSPAALRKKKHQLDAKIKRRKALPGPQRFCALEAEPW